MESTPEVDQVDAAEPTPSDDEQLLPRVPSAPIPGVGVDSNVEPSRQPLSEQQQDASRLFNTRAFRRLWFAQVVSSLGDWIGFVAIAALGARFSQYNGVGLVLVARLGPGLFLAPWAGVLADRLDRRKVMVFCDIGRGAVMLTLPLVDNIWQLILASLLLEAFTLMWMPAKEAAVPSIVKPEFLPTANSLSLVAAYGTFPIGAGIFAVLAWIASAIDNSGAFADYVPNQFNLAFFADAATFFISSFLIFRIAIPHRPRDRNSDKRVDFSGTFDELKEGFWFIHSQRRVRAVILALATGLVGGGMLVPLGVVFSRQVLKAGSTGYGLLQTALGLGLAAGVIGLLITNKRIKRIGRLFVLSVFGAGIAIGLAACSSSLPFAMVWVGFLGVCAGGVYVLGFSILQVSVSDEMRGRTFAALYTLVRLCLLGTIVLSPFIAKFLDKLSYDYADRTVEIFGAEIFLPGVRIMLLIGSALTIFAGFIAAWNLRSHQRAMNGETSAP